MRDRNCLNAEQHVQNTLSKDHDASSTHADQRTQKDRRMGTLSHSHTLAKASSDCTGKVHIG
jgi:hypothetical protein